MHEPFDRKYENHYKISGTGTSTVAGISTRHGGVSLPPYRTLNLGLHVGDRAQDVVENRNRLAATLSTNLDQWVFGEQVHAASIEKVTAVDSGKGSISYESGIMGVDGLYTDEEGILLAAAFADCVPLFFYTKAGSYVGIAHAGWKGTVQEIGRNMVKKWVEHENVDISEIEVVIGPSIQACCYEVDERVIHEVEAILESGETKPYTTNGSDSYQLNLQQLNRQILEKAGILPGNIRVSSRCTSCEVEDFFSHRKEKGQAGRMLGFITKTNREG